MSAAEDAAVFDEAYCKSYPLHAAALKGELDIVVHMIKKSKISPVLADRCRRTPLHLAAHGGRVAVGQALLNKLKAKPNLQDDFGWTPLHFACRAGHLEFVQLLLSNKKTRVDIMNNDLNSPLHFLVSNCQFRDSLFQPLYQKMVLKGTSPNLQNSKGESCLHIACDSGNSQLVSFLLENRADIMVKDISGETCLHHAVRTGKVELTEILLRARADPNICGEHGTPLDVAHDLGHTEVIKILDQKLAAQTMHRRPVARASVLGSVSSAASARYSSWSSNRANAVSSSPDLFQKGRPQAMYAPPNSLPTSDQPQSAHLARSGTGSLPQPPLRVGSDDSPSRKFSQPPAVALRSSASPSPIRALPPPRRGSLPPQPTQQAFPAESTSPASSPAPLSLSGQRATPPTRRSRRPALSSSNWFPLSDTARVRPLISHLSTERGRNVSDFDRFALSHLSAQVQLRVHLVEETDSQSDSPAHVYNRNSVLSLAHYNILNAEQLTYAKDPLHPLFRAHAFQILQSACRCLLAIPEESTASGTENLCGQSIVWAPVCQLLEALRHLGRLSEAMPFAVWLLQVVAQHAVDHPAIQAVRKGLTAWMWIMHTSSRANSTTSELERLQPQLQDFLSKTNGEQALVAALVASESPIHRSVLGIQKACRSVLTRCFELEVWSAAADPRCLSLDSVSKNASQQHAILKSLLSDMSDSSELRGLAAAHLLESVLVPTPDLKISLAPWGAVNSAAAGAGKTISTADRGLLKSVFSDPCCLSGFLTLCRPSSDESVYSSVSLCAARALCMAVHLDLLQSSPELQNCVLSLLYSPDPQLQYCALLAIGHLVLNDPSAGRSLLANNVFERDSLLMRIFALLTAQPHSHQVGVPTTGERVVLACLWTLAVLLRGQPSPELIETLLRLNLVFVLSVSSERPDCVLSVCVILCRVAERLRPQDRSVLLHPDIIRALALASDASNAESNAAQQAALFALVNGVKIDSSLTSFQTEISACLSKGRGLDLVNAKLRVPLISVPKVETMLEYADQVFVNGYQKSLRHEHNHAQKTFSGIIVVITALLRTYREGSGLFLGRKARRLLYQCMCSSGLTMLKRSENAGGLLDIESRIKCATVAADLYHRALENFPGDPLACHQLGVCRFRLGALRLEQRYSPGENALSNYRQANGDFLVAFSKFSSVPKFIDQKVEELAVTGYDPASHYYSYNEFDFSALRQATTLHMGSVLQEQAALKLILKPTDINAVRHSLSSAETKFSLVLERDPSCSRALCGMARCKRDLARLPSTPSAERITLLAEARQFLEKAIRENGKHFIAEHDLAVLDLDVVPTLPRDLQEPALRKLVTTFKHLSSLTAGEQQQRICAQSLAAALQLLHKLA